jgi:hypothetical protein
MKLIKNIICLILILIVCFIFVSSFTFIKETPKIDDFINGYWTSDNNFAKISYIDDMILNIDIENSTGFLIIIIDKEINNSDEFILKIENSKNKCKKKYKEFEIEFLSDDEDFIWYDKKFKAILSIDDGSLKLFHDNTLYADLFKDNKITYILK